MTEIKYQGFDITLDKCEYGTYSFTLNGETESGFLTEDEAYDDACNRIDAMIDSF